MPLGIDFFLCIFVMLVLKNKTPARKKFLIGKVLQVRRGVLFKNNTSSDQSEHYELLAALRKPKY